MSQPTPDQPPPVAPVPGVQRSADDTDLGWGDVPDQDGRDDAHEQWLREQRPPHWD